MRKNVAFYPTISTTWAGMHGEGMQLELSCESTGEKHHFASFIADPADETIFLELTVHCGSIRISVAQLESLIAVAKKDVHSEAWYDKQSSSGSDG
jgi:hypothetical protein